MTDIGFYILFFIGPVALAFALLVSIWRAISEARPFLGGLVTIALAMVAAMLPSTAAFACSDPMPARAFRESDVVVKGTASFDLKTQRGTLKPDRVLKGRKAKSYALVTYVRDDPSQQEACPLWFPQSQTYKGTFYLIEMEPGVYRVAIARYRND